MQPGLEIDSDCIHLKLFILKRLLFQFLSFHCRLSVKSWGENMLKSDATYLILE